MTDPQRERSDPLTHGSGQSGRDVPVRPVPAAGDRLGAGARRRTERLRARIRETVPPGWSWRRVVIGLVVGELAAVVLLLLYLAVSGRSLVVSFERPEATAPAAPSPRLIIPVAGVLATDLDDTWGAPRTASRSHRGIDIRAPVGTPVLAAAAGIIVRLEENRDGGLTIHQRGLDGRTVLYYAHLQRRVGGLAVGDLVAQGDTIAFVGDSGNATGIPHLHFAVYAVSNPNELSNGRHVNPYPLLVEGPPSY